MSHVLKGQECNILWLGKGDILSPFVDSYARGLKCSHKHLFNYCELQWIIYQCSQFSLHVTIICIIIVVGGGHALFFLLSSLSILHGASVMYCCNIYHILACYRHHWYSCSYDLWYSCCWMHPCFALLLILSPLFFNVDCLCYIVITYTIPSSTITVFYGIVDPCCPCCYDL